jgi:hypothetical protein
VLAEKILVDPSNREGIFVKVQQAFGYDFVARLFLYCALSFSAGGPAAMQHPYLAA